MLQAASASALPPCARNHARAECAFSMVSAVVKDLDAIRNSVLSGRTRRSTWPSSWPSTFETKWNWVPASTQASSACTTTSGPKCEPPIPMLSTSVMRASARTCSASSSMASRVWCTCARACTMPPPHCCTTGWSCSSPPSCGVRSSQCMTARCSLALMGAPNSMASRCSVTPQLCARSANNCSVWGCHRFLDRSANTYGACRLSWLKRSGWCAKAWRRSRLRPARSACC